MRQCFIALVFAFSALAASGQTVLLDQTGKQWKVDRLELSSMSEFACTTDLQVFSEDDFDRDGTLDDLCIGAEYDPCEVHSLQRSIYLRAITGGCYSLDERERLRRIREACEQPSFSPSRITRCFP